MFVVLLRKIIRMKLLVLFAFLGWSFSLFSQVATSPNREKLESYLYPFYHGVASGDPLPDAVILWTRFTDDTLTADSVRIDWRIATDTNMTNVVNSGYGYTNASKDWTFKVDATGLQPDTYYFYDFEAVGRHSLRGRTKTAPVGDIDSVRFAVVSCSNWQHEYFHSYRHLMMRNDFDCVLHLGDYIYEYEEGAFSANMADRVHEPNHENITLEDYRLRYSQYHLDDDLRDLHQQFPFIMIWDDHESANDSYKDGAQNHSPSTEGSWTDRKNGSTQAYHEWLPIRSPDMNNKIKIYRKFNWGDLIDLHMLDTRLIARTEQTTNYNDPNKTLLGTDQFNWLTTNLQNSTARWNLLGNQVMMAPLEVFGTPVNKDQWDGYAYEREQFQNFVTNNNIGNLVVLTGDIHTSWVNDLPLSNYDASNCQGSIGVEFVVTSVTSTSFNLPVSVSLIKFANPHVQYAEITKRGYMILDVNKNRVQGDYYYMNDVESPAIGEYFADAYYVNDGEKCANQASGFSSRPTAQQHYYAPEYPIGYNVGIEDKKEMIWFGAYPNPTHGSVTMQIYLYDNSPVNIKIVDLYGKELLNEQETLFTAGANYIRLDLSSLPSGTYTVVVTNKDKRISKPIVKL